MDNKTPDAIVRIAPTTYVLIKVKSINEGRSIRETIDRMITLGLELDKPRQSRR